MKRILSILLAGAMALGLAACGGPSTPDQTTPAEETRPPGDGPGGHPFRRRPDPGGVLLRHGQHPGGGRDPGGAPGADSLQSSRQNPIPTRT